MDSKRRKKRLERIQKEKRSKQIRAMILITVGAVIIVGILIWPSIAPVGEIIDPPERQYPMAISNTLGNPNAPVIIEEFSDFQCVHCLNFFNDTEEELITRFIETGEVYYIFRSFGEHLGAESLAAAEAMYCAGDQEMLWEYRDTLFANFSSGNSGGYSTKRLVAFAEHLGMEPEQFNSCLSSNKYRSRALLDQNDGKDQNVRGTPSFLINGKLISSGYSFESLELEINLALSGGG
jgi:protein-disulfide isomerase